MHGVGRQNEAIAEITAEATEAKVFDVETLFRTHYTGMARMIARVVRDRGRAEELAGEVILKVWRKGMPPEVDHVEAWLYRVAVNAALDALRREARRARYEGLLKWVRVERAPKTPEDLLLMNEERRRVRTVLSVLPKKKAELLLLRGQEFSYEELGAALGIPSNSVGAMLARAREAFRKEYTKRYGDQ